MGALIELIPTLIRGGLWIWGLSEVAGLIRGTGDAAQSAGEGAAQAQDGASRLLVAGALAGGVYLYGKSKRAW